MSTPPTLLIGRCSFWPEARDPEAWLRALVTLSNAAEKMDTRTWTSPRIVGDTVLKGHLSRRGVPGLFGLDDSDTPSLLLGVGLLEWNSGQSSWQLSREAQNLLNVWQTAEHREAMEQFALYLLRHSAWLRLALLKLQTGAWQLVHWHKLKGSNVQIRVGRTLLLGNDNDPLAWLSGIEEAVLGSWWSKISHESPPTVLVHAPKTANPDDGLSLSPLKSPLYLLDSLGWLDASGRLRLPASLVREPSLSLLSGPKPSASALLDQAMAAFSDHRGGFPLEPVMLRFADALGVFTEPTARDAAFIEWTDRLLSESIRAGAIELFSAEPGQARHGRGLHGDARQKLLRWRVHPGFDDICHQVSSLFHQPLEVSTL